MKIIPPNPTFDTSPQKVASKTALPGTGSSFGQVLKQSIDRDPSPVSQTPQTMPISRPQIASNNPLSIPQASAAQVETTLDALESYHSALADPQTTSLRQLEPLLSALEGQRQNMEATLELLPADNPLRKIGIQASAAIVAEQGRFRSGIYN